MRLTVIDRKKLYRREYQRDSIQELTGSVSGENIQESLSRVVAQMITQG
ncbi:hypothetical protein PM10SUCC1_19340 [Propionigenium maris DSM 9537]|uniref:Uncharacterized protein n=1 Tax=Propionigenium maris DSM 9537 TaxID=1123000 RepID=A0A9W6LNY9_9FUSO|nr:hypothetical protein [Propionigenium maris]GLI56420.1 hypothetical protein PM10SUCC1_19340 [Propionigenium maris DSM 9537]